MLVAVSGSSFVATLTWQVPFVFSYSDILTRVCTSSVLVWDGSPSERGDAACLIVWHANVQLGRCAFLNHH